MTNIISFFKLIRYKNLLMLAFTQLIFRYGWLKNQNIDLKLTDFQYHLFVLATVFIAAAGYVINDIFDQEADAINKPNNQFVGKSYSENTAYNIYVTLNIIGVSLGFYISNCIEKPSFASIFIVVAATLYVYATGLKQILVLSNFIIALLAAISIVIIGVFDLYPNINEYNKIVMALFFKVLLDYALFAFVINFIIDIVKDCENILGDNESNYNSIPLVIGIEKTKKIVAFVLILIVIGLFYYVLKFYIENQLFIATFYSFVTILAPLLFFVVKLFSAKEKKSFSELGTILKIILFFGILSIYIVELNINFNAKG